MSRHHKIIFKRYIFFFQKKSKKLKSLPVIQDSIQRVVSASVPQTRLEICANVKLIRKAIKIFIQIVQILMRRKIRKKFVPVGVSVNVENVLVKSLAPREPFTVNTASVTRIYVQKEVMECHVVVKNMAIASVMELANVPQEKLQK